jgi:RNA polymerase sigma-70 factor (ECF subfamily)
MMPGEHPFGIGVPHCLLGELMEIDQTKLQDEDYRYEVLTALVRDYQDRVFRYCVTRLGEVYGEEVAQEVFLTAWKNLPKFRQEAAIETWLVGIARHKCAQAFRNRARRQALAHAFAEDIRQHTHPVTPAVPEHMAVSQTQFVWLAHSLARLRDDERLLLNLRYTKGLSVTEIVELVGKSEAVVRKRLLRALRRLREMLGSPSTM